jgi:O-antigen/teichoic acid export membrane protein
MTSISDWRKTQFPRRGLKSQVGKNSLLLSAGYLLGRLLAFLVFRHLTHLEGSAGAGIWGVAVEITAILIVVAGFGMDSLITREVIKTPENRRQLFLSSLRLRLVTGTISFLVLLLFLRFSGYDEATRQAVLIMSSGLFFETWAMAGDSVFQARERVQLQTLSQVAAALVYFTLAWIWLGQGHGVLGIVWASLASRVLRFLLVVLLVTPLLRHREDESSGTPVPIRWLVAMAWPLFLSSAIGILAFKIDTLMVMAFLGKFETGVYTAGRRLLDLMILAPHLFAVAVFPSLQRCREDGGSDLASLQRATRKAMGWVMLAAVPLAAGGILAAEPLIGLLISRTGFSGSISILRTVMLGLPLISATFVGNRLLLALGLENRLVWVALAALVVNVSGNLVLLPLFGTIGAAVASVCSLLVAWLVYLKILHAAGLRTGFLAGLFRPTAYTAVSWFAAVGLLKGLFPHWGLEWWRVPVLGAAPFLVTGSLVAAFYLILVFLVPVRAGGFRR